MLTVRSLIEFGIPGPMHEIEGLLLLAVVKDGGWVSRCKGGCWVSGCMGGRHSCSYTEGPNRCFTAASTRASISCCCLALLLSWACLRVWGKTSPHRAPYPMPLAQPRGSFMLIPFARGSFHLSLSIESWEFSGCWLCFICK